MALDVKRSVRMAAQTRERQLRSLRTRRLAKVHCEPRLVRVASGGFAEIDRLETLGVPMTIEQVAVSLGLSREAVRLIELRALRKVRAALGIPEPT